MKITALGGVYLRGVFYLIFGGKVIFITGTGLKRWFPTLISLFCFYSLGVFFLFKSCSVSLGSPVQYFLLILRYFYLFIYLFYFYFYLFISLSSGTVKWSYKSIFFIGNDNVCVLSVFFCIVGCIIRCIYILTRPKIGFKSL